MDRVIVGAVGIGTEKNPPMFMVIPVSQQQAQIKPKCSGFENITAVFTMTSVSLCPNLSIPDPNGVYNVPFSISGFDPGSGMDYCQWFLDNGSIQIAFTIFADNSVSINVVSDSPTLGVFASNASGGGLPYGSTFPNDHVSCADPDVPGAFGGSVTISF